MIKTRLGMIIVFGVENWHNTDTIFVHKKNKTRNEG